MAEKLTPQQHKAVYNRGGNLLVSAAAGSGKTKVLVDRLLCYVMDPADPANLDDFLIITYTKAAASELRGKIAAKLTERIAEDPENKHLQRQMQRLFLAKISTVHSFCSDILREYAYKLDLAPDFRVADEGECRELRDLVMADLLDDTYKQIGSDPDMIAFVDTQGLGRDDRFVPEILEKVYDSARCHLNPELWLKQCLDSASVDPETDIAQTIWGKYLIEDLREYLTVQTGIFTECLQAMDISENMEKPAANIRETLCQLQILLEADSWDAVNANRDIDYGRLTFPRKNVDQDLADRVKAARNACKKGLDRKLQNFSDDTAQMSADMQQTASGMRGLISLVHQFQKRFDEIKRKRRVLDFSDLEHKTLDLLLGKDRASATAAAAEIGRRFREIMVDEYQDSNSVQDAIFGVLSRDRHNCFLVGDVKQSIYQFRLADPGIFLEKYQTYADAETAESGQGRRVLLSHNFRSGPEILECANAVFRAAMRPKVGGLHYGDEEALREGIAQAALPDSAVEFYAIDVQEDTYREEALFVAQRIRTMLMDGTVIRKNGSLQPVRPEDIVILLRSPGSAAGAFMQALESAGIRCTTGAGIDLLQAEEISTLRAFLQVILNPRQDIPLLTLLASPVFGFTADDLAAVRSRQKKGTIYDALCLSESDKTRTFLNTLAILRKKARMTSISSLLEECFRLTKFDSIYSAMADGHMRADNLQTFFNLAADFERQNLKDLTQFLDFLNSAESRGLITTGSAGSDAVTIMSIHKSKGLEFPVVFLCNLSRRFNMESLRAQILCDKSLGLGLSVADAGKRIRYPSGAKRAISVKMSAESISEEMRVLYVAMTRARDRLIMTYASQTLESDLQDIVLRQDFDDGELVCQEATCMGDWILLSALKRMEAGSLHALGGRPAQLTVSDHPWYICVCQAPDQVSSYGKIVSQNEEISGETISSLRDGLSFRYPYMAATVTSSKRTATDQKGREKDKEASEKVPEPPQIVRKWRRPTFLGSTASGKEYGNLMHTVMQYISYEACGSRDGILSEIARLEENGFVTAEQSLLVDVDAIERFFRSKPGQLLLSGTPYLREFKFSILVDCTDDDPELRGEQVLMQGVVDCALLETDGITVIDFKTDHVTEDTLPAVVNRYQAQVRTYSEALKRIYEMEVKRSCLYFFRLNRFVEI